MSTHEPLADRDGTPSPDRGDGRPPRSAAVPGASDGDRTATRARRGQGRPNRWNRWMAVLVCLLLLGLVNASVAQPYAIPSHSMEGTLQVGDRVLVDKLAYDFGGRVRRGDVVVFDGRGSFLQDDAAPGGLGAALRQLGSYLGLTSPSETDYVKRVVGVGGDRVVCCDRQGRITVDGVPLDESGYLFPGDTASSVPFDVEVPAGKLWVMGDHRSDSRDSRDHLGEPGGGFVPEDKVIGRADWVVYPFGHWRHLRRPGAYDAVDAAGRSGRHGDQG
ncbi:signal peptidase I [Streptacidiphilus sp. ASG 303]|uniref:signal peptidase I n=1 Tax=Streptomycetaceae TaxID=2062 RepID=UPI001E53B61B|nr:signal peptidase I [Streptacidiphilus sp. ASG 303]MCD0484965.1 signal peptidase I [Streptacidiphilus sp. ASG 303]